jgi:nicotinate-nucleotide adenylyltransferase
VKGVFGGNFNPVHKGHLTLANDALNLLNLEKIFFVPAWKAPLKDNVISASFEDRYNMLKLAVSKTKFFEVLDLESRRKGISYTYDTIKKLIKKEESLCLLIGEDQAINFKKWHKWEKILQIVDVYVFKRSKKTQKYPKGLKALNTKIIEISSTDIRNRIKNGKPVDTLLPEEVLNYIKEHNLYKT